MNTKNILAKFKRKFLRAYAALGAIVLTSVLSVFPTFATAGFNTTALKTGVQTALTVVLSITGAGIAIFGVIHLIEAQGEQDPAAKSRAVKQLASGLGVIVVGAILIPVFMNAITL